MFALLLGIVVIITAIILDTRKAFPYAMVIVLLIQFLYLVQSILSQNALPFENNIALESFKISRNVIILILLFYLALHISIHTVKFLVIKKHKIFTKTGVILAIVITLMTLFNFMLAAFTADFVNIFKKAYAPVSPTNSYNAIMQSPQTSTTQEKLYLQEYVELPNTKNSTYKYLAIYTTVDLINTPQEEINSTGYYEDAYLVDYYAQPRSKKFLARVGLPGISGLTTDFDSVNDTYFIYYKLFDSVIFTNKGEIITNSLRETNQDVKELGRLEIMTINRKETVNPIKVNIGGAGVGVVGEARLDVTTGKIVPGSIKITDEDYLKDQQSQ